MKRKLFAISLVLALLASAYTAYACLSTRGVRVYLMGTQIGAVFANTWQLTLLLSVVLWIPGIVGLLRAVSRRRRTVPAGDLPPTELLADEEKETELLEPRGGAEEETELLEPLGRGGETGLAAPEAVREKTDAIFETGEGPAPPARKEMPPQVCPNCGHPVSGKRFCAKCGTKVGE